ncbi:DNA-directed DNA polymerase [Stappia sp. 22II-S9-Z10]|nr:DNA-directed DNA polymerase [Stappia sp. 22II-S9-Z10]
MSELADTLCLDFETRSAVDLKKAGSYVYAEDPSTDILCLAWAIGDDEVELWTPADPVPDRAAAHIRDGGLVRGWNAGGFERLIFRHIAGPRYGWPVPALEQWRDTMVEALGQALPGKLEDAAPAVGLDIRKDAAGHRLMLQMSKPRKIEDDGTIIWWEDDDRLQRLYAYCRQDVRVEREIAKRVRRLGKRELSLWQLDQRVNDRGVRIDVESCEAAKIVAAQADEALTERMRLTTCFEVAGGSDVQGLRQFCCDRDVKVDSVAKDVVIDLLEDEELPADVRAALEIRLEFAKTSVAKVNAMLRSRNDDGRARGLLQFNGASTGRWGGRRIQTQNMKRTDEGFDVAEALTLIGTGDAVLVEAFIGAPKSAISNCLRGLIQAAPDHDLIAADYANIEGRVLAWLAGEEWKLDAFRAFDRGEGHDLYRVAYGAGFGKDPGDVSKDERQVGKVMELALGYQGGVGAFNKMGANYGVTLPKARVEEIRDAWRASNPAIKSFWYELEAAAMRTVEDGLMSWQAVGRCGFQLNGSFLEFRLPSGRSLWYAYPDIRPKQMPWTDDGGNPVWKDSVSYMGVDSTTRKWKRQFAYGGLLAENCTQAVARDILAHAMPLVEAAGYPLVMHVHDELVVEVPKDFGSVDDVCKVMCQLPAWADGCPVVAAGWRAERYKK